MVRQAPVNADFPAGPAERLEGFFDKRVDIGLPDSYLPLGRIPRAAGSGRRR
jgi:hypothetical protein